MDTITYVDDKLKVLHEKLQDFFKDNQTTYIFTADHGMTSRGSHGDGHPECTRTPFVVWGHSARVPSQGHGKIISDGTMEKSFEENYVSTSWNLNPAYRKDIRQADLAPLMASILGVTYPVNNLGTVPLAYLGGNESFRTWNLFTNAKQIYEQYLQKEKTKQRNTPIMFRKFAHLSSGNETLVQEIEQMIVKEYYTQAQKRCYQLIELSLQGLHYYQTYDWQFLMTVVVCGYLSWIVFVLVYAVRHYTQMGESMYENRDISNVEQQVQCNVLLIIITRCV